MKVKDTQDAGTLKGEYALQSFLNRNSVILIKNKV